MDTTTGLKEQIQEKYGAAARRAAIGAKDASCCSGSSCCGTDQITENLYSDSECGALPDAAVTASLGCGNPTAVIELERWRVYDIADGRFASAFVRATKPTPQPCCGTDCCKP